MANVLENLGFNTAPCTPGKHGPGPRSTSIAFGSGPLYLDMDPETAARAYEMLGKDVDFGVAPGFKVAICKGDSRVLCVANAGRRKMNISSARDNLLSFFPNASASNGRNVLVEAYMDEVEFDEDNGVVVFKPSGFRYSNGSGLHYCSAKSANCG